MHVRHWSEPEQQEVSLPRSLSGWQKTCREEDVEWPRMGRRPYAFPTQRYRFPSELVTPGSQARGLGWFSESQQGGREGEGKEGVGLPPPLSDSWLQLVSVLTGFLVFSQMKLLLDF